jgi:bacteriocin-like protein
LKGTNIMPEIPDHESEELSENELDQVSGGGGLLPGAFKEPGDPVVYKRTGIRSFYIDETGILLGQDTSGGDGTSSMPEI